MHFEVIPTKENILERVSAVTVEDIQKMASQIFRNNRINLVMIGKCNRQRQKNIRLLKII
jgi:predicted Zn-dependent peptidase